MHLPVQKPETHASPALGPDVVRVGPPGVRP